MRGESDDTAENRQEGDEMERTWTILVVAAENE